MERLIITADEALYRCLAQQAQADGDSVQQAADVLDGLAQAIGQRPGMIMLDMLLRSADTLLASLRCRPETSDIPLLAIAPSGQLPFELRRLCSAVLHRENLKNGID